jgi:tetratricopeptide (TPR) repeat protein
MRLFSLANPYARQDRKDRQRFAPFFVSYAERHWQAYDLLDQYRSNFQIALDLLIQQQSAAQIAELIRSLSSFWLARGYWQEALNYCGLVHPLLDNWRSTHATDQQVELGWAGVRLVAVAAQFHQGWQQEALATLQDLLDELRVEDAAISLLLLLFASLVDHTRGQTIELDVLYDKWLTRIGKIDDPSIRGSALDLIARQLADQGEFERSIELLREKVSIDSQQRDINAIGETLRTLASVATAAGLTEVADDCLQEAAQISAAYGRTDLYVEALNERASAALKQENYPLAADLYGQVLAIARQGNNRPAIADALRLLAFATEELGQDVSNLLEESLAISRDIHDYAGMVRSWIQLGTLAQEQNMLDRALNQFEQARDLAEQIGDQALLATAWQQLGELAEEQSNWVEARRCYERGLAASNLADEPGLTVSVLRDLGHVLLHLHDLDRAVEAFDASAELSAQIKDWEQYAANLYDLAYVAALRGDAHRTRELSQMCVDVLRRANSPQLQDSEAALAYLEQTLASGIGDDQPRQS